MRDFRVYDLHQKLSAKGNRGFAGKEGVRKLKRIALVLKEIFIVISLFLLYASTIYIVYLIYPVDKRIDPSAFIFVFGTIMTLVHYDVIKVLQSR